MIIQASIQEVIQRANIVEIVSQFVRLKQRGSNYIGNCPFHNEKTPSFNVNPSKGIFKCFGCGKSGDVISFVEEYEKLTFYETIKWLANYYQIELQETQAAETYKQQQHIEESLRIINDFAAKYFENVLWNEEEGQLVGLSYFRERGFSDHTIKQFQLGYSFEQWDNFLVHAKAQGFSQEILKKAGLIRIRDNGQIYDTYRGRVVFPIFSPTGKVLGFGARILKTDGKQPKYINTQESEIYIKNKVLYGLYQSRQSINREDECLLVEGYTDVISLFQAGVTNVVASSGTSLTEGQLKLISNLTKNITIIYDGDAAGIKAALRGLDKALSESFNVKLVLLPEGEDPDSYVQKIGEKQFKAYILENKQDIISFRLEVGMKEVGNDPIKKSQFVNDIAETLSKINKLEGFALRSHYIKESAQKLGVDEQGLINLVNKFIREDIRQNQRQQEREAQETPIDTTTATQEEENSMGIDPIILPAATNLIEWSLLRNLIEYGNKPYKDEGTIAQKIFETIDVDIIEDSFANELFTITHQHFNTQGAVPPISFYVNNENKIIREKVATLINDEYTPSNGWKEIVKIEVPFGEDIYESDLESILAYFELKIVRHSIAENLLLMQKENDPAQQLHQIMVHQKLKEQEKNLQRFVILK
jgi:DNA primase